MCRSAVTVGTPPLLDVTTCVPREPRAQVAQRRLRVARIRIARFGDDAA
jgi:hypothetical protein